MLAEFSFRRIDGRERPDLEHPRLLKLRQDLVAVFDGTGYHVGVVKKLRGRWTFLAVGYGDDHEPVPRVWPDKPGAVRP